jgi:tape measure domain-containing protein
MALQVGELFAKLSLDDREFNRGLASAKTNFGQLGAALTQLGGMLSVAVTAPLAGVGYAAVRSGMQMDSLKRGLTAVAGSADAANAQLKGLKEIAKLPGLGMAEAIQGSINLQAAGLSADLAEDALKGFGNALATVGKGKAELEGVQMALSQIMSKGTVSAEEINQIAERVPQIRKIMQAAFGTSNTEELQKMGLSSEEFISKVVVELNKLPKVAGGAQNSWENMTDAIQSALVSMWPTIEPIFTGIVNLVTTAVGLFEKLPGPVKGLALGLGLVAAAAGPVLLLMGSLISAWTSVETILPVVRVLFSATWKAALGPIGWVIAGVTALAVGATYLYNHWEPARKFFDGLWNGVKTVFSKFWDWAKRWGFLLAGPGGAVYAVIKNWGTLRTWFANLWDKLAGDAEKGGNKVAVAAAKGAKDAKDAITKVSLSDVVSKWNKSIDEMVSKAQDLGKKTREGLKGWADEIIAELDKFREDQKSRYDKMNELGPAGIAAMQNVVMFGKKNWTPENLPSGAALKGIFARNEAAKAGKDELNTAVQRKVFGWIADLPAKLEAAQVKNTQGMVRALTDTAINVVEMGNLVDLARQQIIELKKLNQPLPSS